MAPRQIDHKTLKEALEMSNDDDYVYITHKHLPLTCKISVKELREAHGVTQQPEPYI